MEKTMDDDNFFSALFSVCLWVLVVFCGLGIILISIFYAVTWGAKFALVAGFVGYAMIGHIPTVFWEILIVLTCAFLWLPHPFKKTSKGK
jgi:hypothetical protein